MTGRKYFLNVQKGAFMEKPEPGKQTNTFEKITGHLVNITFKETAYGPAMRLHVVDEHNFYMLSMFVHSRPANAFFMIVKNLDLLKEMEFKIKSSNGKDYFSINQYFGPVLWFYTMENAGDLPRDAEEKRDFFINMIKEEIVPALQKKLNPYPSNAMYKPMAKGLAGGYFEGFKTSGRTPSPVSSFERSDRKTYGNNRPL